MTHLECLRLSLSHERVRLANATTDGERKLRQVWVAQIEKEIAGEEKFIGATNNNLNDMSDDELLSELKS